jgi:predicted molibdopterin-dependent oxidoreductase YjgC
VRTSVGAHTSALAERLAGREPLKLVINAPSRAAELLAAARAACAPAAGPAGVQVLPRGANAQGARDVGFASAFLPGYRRAPAAGRNLDAIARAAQAGEIGTVLLVQLDKPSAGNGSASPAPMDFGRARRVVFTSFLGPACEAADVVLPAQTPLESSGTRTNPDRRVLPVSRTMPPAGVSQPVWALAQALSNLLGNAWNHASEQDVFAAIRNEAAPYRSLDEIGPGGKAWDITSLRTA